MRKQRNSTEKIEKCDPAGLVQSFNDAEPERRVEIRRALFELSASGNCDATIECMCFAGMYTPAQREDYYRIKQWCEDVDNSAKPKKCVKTNITRFEMNQFVKVTKGTILEDNTLQRFTELVPDIERSYYFSWYFESKKRGNYLVLIRDKVIEVPADEVEFDYSDRLTHASA